MSTSTSTFVKKLASSDRLARESAFESLQKYLKSKSTSQLSLLDLEKLWKGLYYAMWCSDKPKPQESLAENLGQLFSEVVPIKALASFHEAFWVIIIREWPEIDQWRIDKFYLLIRRVLRHNFKRLQSISWEEKEVSKFLAVLEKLPLSGDKSISVALPYHLGDIYLDELEVVLFENLEEDEIDDVEDKEERVELLKQALAEKLKIVDECPIKSLLSPFEKLSKSALLKTLREKIKAEVLEDQRLKDWGVVESESAEENDDEDEDTDSEWKGF